MDQTLPSTERSGAIAARSPVPGIPAAEAAAPRTGRLRPVLCWLFEGEGYLYATLTVEDLLIALQAEILAGEPRLDPANQSRYSLSEAKAAFDRVAKAKGWL